MILYVLPKPFIPQKETVSLGFLPFVRPVPVGLMARSTSAFPTYFLVGVLSHLMSRVTNSFLDFSLQGWSIRSCIFSRSLGRREDQNCYPAILVHAPTKKKLPLLSYIFFGTAHFNPRLGHETCQWDPDKCDTSSFNLNSATLFWDNWNHFAYSVTCK